MTKIPSITTTDKVRNIMTTMTKKGTLPAIVLLEATVTGGRTIQAQKRGGFVESRERLTEETIGAIFWLFSMQIFNAIANIFAKPIFKLKDANFDSGKDAVRNPMENLITTAKKEGNNLNKNSLIAFKATKLAMGIVASTALIGFLVPKLNQKITKTMFGKKENEKVKNAENIESKSFSIISNKKNNDYKSSDVIDEFSSFRNKVISKEITPSFKSAGMYNTIAFISDKVENTAIGRLMASDVGVISGRTINARNNDERIEILIRDAGSVYFYLFAIAHVEKLLNKFDMFKGKNTNIDPNSANSITNLVSKYLKSNGGSVSVEKFRKDFFVDPKLADNVDFKYKIKSQKALKKLLNYKNVELKTIKNIIENSANDFDTIDSSLLKKYVTNPNDLKKVVYETEIIKLNDFIKKYPQLKDKATLISDMQPETSIGKILTRQQVNDVLSKSKITEGSFIFEIIDKMLSENKKGGILKNPYRYIPQSTVEAKRILIDDYMQSIISFAKKLSNSDNEASVKITQEVLEKCKTRNLKIKSLYFLSGFAIAAAFLSTLIPKFQYWVTKKRTGENQFPGIENLEIDTSKLKK